MAKRFDKLLGFHAFLLEKILSFAYQSAGSDQTRRQQHSQQHELQAYAWKSRLRTLEKFRCQPNPQQDKNQAEQEA